MKRQEAIDMAIELITRAYPDRDMDPEYWEAVDCLEKMLVELQPNKKAVAAYENYYSRDGEND